MAAPTGKHRELIAELSSEDCEKILLAELRAYRPQKASCPPNSPLHAFLFVLWGAGMDGITGQRIEFVVN